MITVFYIDDEANSEKMKSKFEMLKINSINVIAEHNIKKVENRIKEIINDIDLILLDIIMPPRNYFSLEETNGGTSTGIVLLKKIRENFKDIPIIIVSIQRIASLDEILERYNVSGYVKKPYNVNELVEQIHIALGKRV